MRKLVVPAAVLAGLVMTVAPGVALAQEAGPVRVDPSTACGRVTLSVTVPGSANPSTGAFPTYELAVFSGPNSGDAKADALGQFRVSAKESVSQTFTLDEDAYGGSGFVSWSTISGPERNFYASGTVAVKTDCGADPAPTTTPAPTEDPDPTETPDPTEDPEPTETPDPTTTPAPTTEAPPFNDLDCRDFPLADGRTAQDILNQTPTDDPNGLDADEDRIACEPGQDTAADGGDIADNDEPVGDVVTPSGGVATGGGPAWAFQ